MKYLLLSLLPLVFSGVVSANTISIKLHNKIEQAQTQLTLTEQKIANERKRVTTKLNKLELEVLALRDKAAVALRLSDEKTLSLSKLEERLASWRKQDVYQKNLLHRFLQQHREYSVNIDKHNSDNHLAATIKIAQQLKLNLTPTWLEKEIVQPSGDITTMPTLMVGPVTWYWDDTVKQAGIASIHDKSQGLLHSDVMLPNNASNTIAQLRHTLHGNIVFDPTLSGAMVKQQNTESIVQHVMKGGLWAMPIIAFGVFALIIALVKTIQLVWLPKIIRFTPAALNNALTSTEHKSAISVRGMQKVLLELTRNEKSARKRDDQLFIELQDNKLWLERWIGGIAVTAAISPLLGLLGTVSGMIETFKMMTLFGSGDPAVVSGGIAQALVTTELGLVVAIPALILNAILSRRAKAYYNDLESFAILLSKTSENNHLTSAELMAEASNEQLQAIAPITPKEVKA